MPARTTSSGISAKSGFRGSPLRLTGLASQAGSTEAGGTEASSSSPPSATPTSPTTATATILKAGRWLTLQLPITASGPSSLAQTMTQVDGASTGAIRAVAIDSQADMTTRATTTRACPPTQRRPPTSVDGTPTRDVAVRTSARRTGQWESPRIARSTARAGATFL